VYKESRKSYRIVLIIGAALFSLAASHLQVHYTLISFSLLPFAIFLIGSFLDERDALLSQILFSLLYFTLSGFLTGVLGIAHTPISFGYVLGTVPACWLVARLVKTENTWKAKYGGMEASDIKRLKELEAENRRLKQMYANLSLENEALKDILEKKI